MIERPVPGGSLLSSCSDKKKDGEVESRLVDIAWICPASDKSEDEGKQLG